MPQTHNLLIHQAALGDWLLLFPLLRDLAQLGPTRAVTSLDKARLAAALITGVQAVNSEQHDFTLLHTPDGAARVSETQRGQWAALRRIVSFVSDGCDAWAGNVRRLASQAEVFFVPPRPPSGWTEHVSAWHRQALARQGWVLIGSGAAPNQTRQPPEAAALHSDVKPIVIHPGSGGRDKCWPLARFIELVDALREGRPQMPVQVIVGEVEVERWSAHELAALRAQVLPTLDALRDALAGAALYIGNDSGPTHLAAWLGVPTIALFGPSDPRLWAPLGRRVTVLAPPTPEPMAWLPTPRVLDALAAVVS
ncbi:MAG: glycosyltransferase family 9 protein [Phycisphaeraceae bacterium]